MGRMRLWFSDLAANHKAKVNLLQRLQVVSIGVPSKKKMFPLGSVMSCKAGVTQAITLLCHTIFFFLVPAQW